MRAKGSDGKDKRGTFILEFLFFPAHFLTEIYARLRHSLIFLKLDNDFFTGDFHGRSKNEKTLLCLPYKLGTAFVSHQLHCGWLLLRLSEIGFGRLPAIGYQ